MTFDEALFAWRAELKARGYASRTRELYAGDLEAFLAWLGAGVGQRLVTSVTRAEVLRYQDELASSRYAKQTQAMRIRAVKRFFEWLMGRGVLFESPTRGVVETPVDMKRLPHVLTVEEVERLLASPNTSTVRGIRDRAALELAYATGLRLGELRALDLADVDLEGAVVRVRSGKGQRGRVVPFGPTARRWLGEYVRDVRPRLERRAAKRERAFFLNRFGGRTSGRTIANAVEDAARAAGIEGAHVHGLRHAFATHLVAAGMDAVTVKMLLGHARLQTTQVYTRLVPVDLKREHERTHPEATGRTGSALPPSLALPELDRVRRKRRVRLLRRENSPP